MEVGGTIVGTLSLGITVCDGIIKYCRSWKNQDDDVRALIHLTGGLKQLLEDLDTRLQPNSGCDPIILQRVKSSVQECTAHIDSVVCLSDKYTPGQSSGLKGKAKDLVQKLKFPFEKKALDELREIMVAFRGNVDTALQLLIMDIARTDREAVQSIRQESKIMHNQALGSIQNASVHITQSIARDLAQRLPVIEDSVTSSLAQRIEHSTVSIDNTISQSSVAIREDIQSSLMLQRQQIDALQEQKLQLKTLAQSLALLRPVQTLKEEHRNLLGQNLSSGAGHKRRGVCSSSRIDSSLCNCKPTAGIESFYSPFKRFGKQREAYLIHDRTCPLWYTSKKDTSYRVSLLLFQRLLIFGSVHVRKNPYAAISGLGITNNLSCQYVVPSNAPSFKVLWWHLSRLEKFSCLDYCISRCVRDLRIVFQSGHGSPQDTLEDGRNLLYMAFTIVKDFYDYPEKWLLQLTRQLVGMGIQFREGDSSPGDFVQYSSLAVISALIFERPSFQSPEQSLDEFDHRTRVAMDLLLWLTGEGFELPDLCSLRRRGGGREEHAPWHGFKISLNAQKQNEDLAIAMECGALSRAVLRQDETSVKKILEQRPGSLRTERNVCGHTAIHLAIGWVRGLKILLSAADESTLEGIENGYPFDIDINTARSTPLDHAIAFGCIESIRLLANADFGFNFHWNLRVGTKALDPAISDVVLSLVLERLRQLHRFSLQNLPAEVVRALQIECFENFDTKAYSVFNYFRAMNIPIPRKFRSYVSFWGDSNLTYFCPSFGGIFHQQGIHPKAAKAFFDAGIRNVDCEVEQITPLMTTSPSSYITDRQFHFSSFFGLVDFLVSHGARLDKEICSRYIKGETAVDSESQRRYRAIHRIASKCWIGVLRHDWYYYPLFNKKNVITIARLGSTKIWRQILGDTISDACDCACSLGGCRPISLALKNALGRRRQDMICSLRERDREPQDDSIFSFGLTLLENVEGQQIEEDVIRFLTFSALGLTHTCCRHVRYFCPQIGERTDTMIHLMDVAEIHEIHDEEVELIERLDHLVKQFMKQLHELKIPFTTFLREYWKRGIQAEILAKDGLSEREKERFQELGVKLLEDDEADKEEDNDALEENDGYDSYEEWIEGIASSIR